MVATPQAGRAGVVADLLCSEATALFPWLTRDRERLVLGRIQRCQTGALGTRGLVCDDCVALVRLVPNSCRDRHCPRCQRRAQAAWAEAMADKLPPVPLFQVVFTLPGALRPLARRHRRGVFDAMFAAAAETLNTLAAQRLGAQLAFVAVLHTWSRDMRFHPHVHVLVSAGGLDVARHRWVSTGEKYLFPKTILSQLFRGKLLARLSAGVEAGKLDFEPDQEAGKAMRELAGLKRHLRAKSWVVHIEPPEGRSPGQAVRYLARYVFRVAIDDRRIVDVTPEHVTFKTRDRQTCTLTRREFARRYMQHVLPRGLRKVRSYGLLAPGNVRTRLVQAKALLAQADGTADDNPPAADDDASAGTDLDAITTADDGPKTETSAPPCPICGSHETWWVRLPRPVWRDTW